LCGGTRNTSSAQLNWTKRAGRVYHALVTSGGYLCVASMEPQNEKTPL
jgi:hypothetical protein